MLSTGLPAMASACCLRCHFNGWQGEFSNAFEMIDPIGLAKSTPEIANTVDELQVAFGYLIVLVCTSDRFIHV
jgi:hypothetical protein